MCDVTDAIEKVGGSMSTENEAVDSGMEVVIECNEALDVSLVSDFKVLLQQASGQNSPIVLDASLLERIDGAGLQLVTAFFQEAAESGLSVSWRNPTEALIYAADLTGLKDVLQL